MLVRAPFLPIFNEAPGLPMLALLIPLCVRLIFNPGSSLILLGFVAQRFHNYMILKVLIIF